MDHPGAWKLPERDISEHSMAGTMLGNTYIFFLMMQTFYDHHSLGYKEGEG